MSTARVTLRLRGGASLRADVRVLVVLGLVTAAALVAFVLSIARGEYGLPPGEVLATLVGAGDEADRFIVVDLRLPRALVALLCGVALGVAGAILQDVTRNPLASPDIVGIGFGGALAAITLIVLGKQDGALSVPLAALVGSCLTGALLYALAWRNGLHGYRLVLVGIGLTALLQAGISYVLTRGRLFEVQQAYVWLVGSLHARGWEHVRPIALAVALLLPVGFLLARSLSALQLGDDLATALGAAVERQRLALVAVAVALTGLAVSAAGPISFVAFVAPHLARRAGGSIAPGAVLPLAAAFGALVVLLADLLGRELLAPTEIPVGIVTSILAAPYFLLLLRRADRPGATP